MKPMWLEDVACWQELLFFPVFLFLLFSFNYLYLFFILVSAGTETTGWVKVDGARDPVTAGYRDMH